jgi:hypothetical protein
MEAQGADASALLLETALRELRDAIELREAEHARRNRDRVLFARGVTLFFLGIILGLIVLGRVFDPGIFRDRLYEKVQADAPSVVRHLREGLGDLAELNRAEVNRTLPTFALTLEGAVKPEAARLRSVLQPLTAGDPAALTAVADQTFAVQLRDHFSAAHLDEAHALALAHAIHVRILKDPAGPHDATMVLGDVGRTLRGLGPATPGAFQERETADALSNAALDVIRERMLAGELGLTAPDAKEGQEQ